MPNPRTAAEWAMKCLTEHDSAPALTLCIDCADTYARQQVREALDEMHKRLGSLIHRNKKGDLIADDWGCAVAACQNEIGAALREGK